jgi:PAS domain S-box-containing protein
MQSDKIYNIKMRKKAEDLVRIQYDDGKAHSKDYEDLLYELRVHQIELEMQNDELMNSLVKLEDSRLKYFNLYNFAPVGYFTLDKEGIILEVNIAGAELLGFERLKLHKTPFILYIEPKQRNMFQHRIMMASETGTKQSFEIKLLKSDKNSFYVHLEIIVVKDAQGNFKEFTIIASDIQDIKNKENALKKSENYREIFFNDHTVMMVIDPNNGDIIDANPAAVNFYGYKYHELIKMKISDIRVSDLEDILEEMQHAANKQKNHFIFKHRLSNGEIRDVDVYSGLINQGGRNLLYSIIHDITDQKKVEFERETTTEFLHIVNESTSVQDLILSTLNFFKQQSKCEAVGIRLQEEYDYPYYQTNGFPEEFIQLENHLCVYDKMGNPLCGGDGNPIMACMCGNVIGGTFDPSQQFFTNNGSFWTNSTSNLLENTSVEDRQSRTRNRCNGEGYESVALIPLHSGVENLGLLQLNDGRKNLFTEELILIWERLAGHLSVALAKFKAEEEIINHDNLLDSINQIFQESLAYDTETEVIEKCLEVAEELTESEFGFFGEVNENGRLDDRALSPPAWDVCETPNAHELLKDMEIRSYWGRTIIEEKSQVVNQPDQDPDRRGLPEGHPIITSFLGVPLKEGKKTIGMIALANKKSGYTEEDKSNVETISAAFVEVLMRKRAEIKIKENLKDLAQSNKELEQFAYITSHDLREPLRMITSFLQLLERRYKDNLDQDANDFIGYAVNGAKRLDAMTNDLLKYSKISSEKREIKPVNYEHVLEEALINLKVPIEENKAVITHDPLPTINGDEELKVQLFQNLISNSIKYRSKDTPKIHISATKETNQYLFSIEDNGIGMSSEHLERIFTIFQRLHTHEEYEGTGIGLAIAQKIVHQQGGQIWAESELGKGTTFYFTVPIKTKLSII